MMTGAGEELPVFSIGAIVMGLTPSSRAWKAATMSLSQEIRVARAGVSTSLKVNVEFHVPGHIARPEFEGIRTGFFRKRDSALKVQVALPDEVPERPREYLLDTLDDALGAVGRWAARRRLDVDLASLRGIVAALRAAQT